MPDAGSGAAVLVVCIVVASLPYMSIFARNTGKDTPHRDIMRLTGGIEMGRICGIQNAIDDIGNHLIDKIDYEEVAKQSFSSSYHFQRIFGILCGYTLGENIRLEGYANVFLPDLPSDIARTEHFVCNLKKSRWLKQIHPDFLV